MFWGSLTDNKYFAFSLNNFTVTTHWFNRCSNFHLILLKKNTLYTYGSSSCHKIYESTSQVYGSREEREPYTNIPTPLMINLWQNELSWVYINFSNNLYCFKALRLSNILKTNAKKFYLLLLTGINNNLELHKLF